MFTLQDAQTLVHQYAQQTGAIRFGNPIIERDTYWFFPVGYIGSQGVIVEKATGRLHAVGSAPPLDDAFWAHEHGFSPDRVTLRILRIHDLRSTVELLLNVIKDGPPRQRNPIPKRASLEEILGTLPHEFAPQPLWLAAPALRKAAERGWFEYQIVEPAAATPPATLKLATWNLEKPVSPRRREAIRAHTDREQADIWVPTETHDGFTPGHAFSHSSAPGCDGHSAPEHRWVTIWSRHPIEPLATSDVERTAAARITPDSGDPFLVYGTVFPWIGSTWRGHPSAEGVAFREALAVQLDDWMRLRRDYPADELLVLGDLNQDLVNPRYYGSRANRDALEAALEQVGLTALTAGEGDPIRRDSSPRACIDHICAGRDSRWRPGRAVRWPDLPAPDRWLSDHFGVSMVLTSVAAQLAPPPCPAALT